LNVCRALTFFILLVKYSIQLKKMKISSHYKGKEQSFIKHRLLETYLERLFMIIGQHESRIRYVDWFAGPWKAESDDLRDTSIAISLGLMKACQENLEKKGKNVRFQALFIEKNIESYKKLNSFLQTESTEEVSADSLHGDFYSLSPDGHPKCPTYGHLSLPHL